MTMSAGGDRLAFEIVAARYAGRVWRVAYRITGRQEEADEIAQDVLLRAWRSAGRFDCARGTLAAWLNRITVNLAADRYREAMNATPLSEELADPAPLPQAGLEAIETRRELAAGLAALPERQRRAITLTYLEERPGTEAAAALGISMRALEGLLHRARRFLRERYAREA